MRYLALLLLPGLAYAQGFAPAASGPRSVSVQAPDGGTQVLQVTGVEGGAVNTVVTDPVTLNESSTATIRTPVPCTVGRTPRLDVPTFLTRLPPRFPDGGSYTGLQRRTEIIIRNVDSKDTASCQFGPVDAGVAPNCSTPGWGDTVDFAGGTARYEVSEAYEVWCIGCGGAATVEVTEALCVP